MRDSMEHYHVVDVVAVDIVVDGREEDSKVHYHGYVDFVDRVVLVETVVDRQQEQDPIVGYRYQHPYACIK